MKKYVSIKYTNTSALNEQIRQYCINKYFSTKWTNTTVLNELMFGYYINKYFSSKWTFAITLLFMSYHVIIPWTITQLRSVPPTWCLPGTPETLIVMTRVPTAYHKSVNTQVIPWRNGWITIRYTLTPNTVFCDCYLIIQLLWTC